MSYKRGDRVLVSNHGIIEVGFLGEKILVGPDYYLWRFYNQRIPFYRVIPTESVIIKFNPLEPCFYVKKNNL